MKNFHIHQWENITLNLEQQYTGNTHYCWHRELNFWREFVWYTMVLCNSFEVIYGSWIFHSACSLIHRILEFLKESSEKLKLRKDTKYTIQLHTSQAKHSLRALWRTVKIWMCNQQGVFSTQREGSLPKSCDYIFREINVYRKVH